MQNFVNIQSLSYDWLGSSLIKIVTGNCSGGKVLEASVSFKFWNKNSQSHLFNCTPGYVKKYLAKWENSFPI